MRQDHKRVEFTLRPSRSLLFYRLGFLGVIAITLFVQPLPEWVWVLSGLALVVVAFFVLPQPNRKLAVLSCSGSEWQIQSGREIKKLVLCDQQFVTRYLVVLYFLAKDGQRIHKVLARDSLAEGQHRELRKLLLTNADTHSLSV